MKFSNIILEEMDQIIKNHKKPTKKELNIYNYLIIKKQDWLNKASKKVNIAFNETLHKYNLTRKEYNKVNGNIRLLKKRHQI